MYRIKSFKIFESASNRPNLKFPTDKTIHMGHIINILEKSGINPFDIKIPGHKRSGNIHTFFSDKFTDRVVFPNLSEQKVFKSSEKHDVWGECFFITINI